MSSCVVNELSGVISDLPDEIFVISKQFNDFQLNLRECIPGSNCTTKTEELGDIVYSGVINTTFTKVLASTVKPVSYSAVVFGNISDIVKIAVAKSIREQRIADRDRASVAMHNMREHGNKVRNMQELGEFRLQ